MVDYSKWKNIEVSDDEDDTHPNIDTASLFRWRHQARVERMEETEREKREFEEEKRRTEAKLKEIEEKAKMRGAKEAEEAKAKAEEVAAVDDEKLKEELQKLKIEQQKLKEREAELKKKEKLTPWNVDTISKPGWSKTILNKPTPKPDRSQESEEDQAKRYDEFVKKYEKEVKHYGMMSKWDDCRSYLGEHGHLACDETASYLALWCLNLEMQGKSQLMEHVAKQCVAMQYILELSKQLDCHPRACVSAFFTRIQKADKEYQDAFDDELKAFKQRIRKRAQVRLEQAMKEVEEEEKQKRLGPGGLDPVEVFESLPPELQKCFESRDTQMLQQVIAALNEDDARYHMKRCVDSGLWVADAKSLEKSDGDDAQKKEGDGDDEEEVYHEVN